MVRRWSTGFLGTLAVAAWMALSAGLAEGADRAGSQSVFSEEEYRALFSTLETDVRQARQSPLPDLEGDPIELEAYVVDGDGTLLLAALRRHLELGPVSIRERVAELAPVLSRQAQFSGRQSDVFLAAPALGRPSDAAEPVPFDLDDVITVQRAIFRAVQGVLPER